MNELRSRGWKIHDGYSIYLQNIQWVPLGSAEGGRKSRKRRLDEEFAMMVDEDDVLNNGTLTQGFVGVNWSTDSGIADKKARNGVVA